MSKPRCSIAHEGCAAYRMPCKMRPRHGLLVQAGRREFRKRRARHEWDMREAEVRAPPQGPAWPNPNPNHVADSCPPEPCPCHAPRQPLIDHEAALIIRLPLSALGLPPEAVREPHDAFSAAPPAQVLLGRNLTFILAPTPTLTLTLTLVFTLAPTLALDLP